MLIDDHQPNASDDEPRIQQTSTKADQRLAISVEEAGRVLGISRGLAYELSTEATSQASGSAVASSSRVVRSIACWTCQTTRPEPRSSIRNVRPPRPPSDVVAVDTELPSAVAEGSATGALSGQ
jgi:hypothetical protein